MNSDSTEYEWYIALSGQRYGPMSFRDMCNLVSTGHLTSEDLVWREGFDEWQQAQTISGLINETPVESVVDHTDQLQEYV